MHRPALVPVLTGLLLSVLSFACSVEDGARGEASAAAASCEGHCGDAAPSGCQCDADCAGEGDCCSDAADVCSVTELAEDAAWVGTPCVAGEGTCDFSVDGQDGACIEFEDGEAETHGFCSVPCAGVCPDRDGFASTFCVGIDGAGQCASQASSGNNGCDDIPGTRSKFTSRFVGDSGVSSASRATCMPDTGPAASTGDLAADLLALTEECSRLPGTDLFRTDAGRSRTIPMCQLEGAIFWRADGDIDCDGGRSSPCTEDPWYQASTSSKDSDGNFIDSATVPHFVVPMSGSGFTASEYGIRTGWNAVGSAGAIIYDGKLIFAPYADAGPRHVLGELSSAAARELGIPNHPVSGGVSSGVTYIVFTGNDAYVDPIESRDSAESIGEELARRLLDNN